MFADCSRLASVPVARVLPKDSRRPERGIARPPTAARFIWAFAWTTSNLFHRVKLVSPGSLERFDPCSASSTLYVGVMSLMNLSNRVSINPVRVRSVR